MAWLKWIAIALVVAVVGALLNFYLPDRDIVRIVGTDIARREGAPAADTGAAQVRDVRYINAVRAGGGTIVYRNEDTGWGWPPYFKFNSADLAAEAENAISSERDPQWMVVTNYGWRITWLSQFPNAVSMRPATGPDETLIPWFNIVLIAVLALAVLTVRRLVLGLFGFGRS
jgi:hypothetical protein